MHKNSRPRKEVQSMIEARTQTEQTVKILRDGEGPVVPDQRITNKDTKTMPDNCIVVPMKIVPKPEPIPKRK